MNIKCPKCGSTEVVKRGYMVSSRTGRVQRWTCKKCYFTFCETVLKKLKKVREDEKESNTTK